jgi:colicin import membrane protein
MRLFFNTGDEPGFQKILIISLVLHLIFIAVTVVPLSSRKREIKNYYVNLVSPAAIRSRERPRIAKAAKKVRVRTRRIPPKKSIKSKADMMLESAEVSKAIDRIQQKKKEEEEKARRLADLRARIKEDASKVEETAPEEAPGTEEESEAPDLYAGIGEYDARLLYEARVRQRIEAYWEMPHFDAEGLVAVFDIRVDKDWRIVSSRIIKSSGNRLFDRSAIKAMNDAGAATEYDPLPEPPLEMQNEILKEGIEFKFYAEE